MEFFDYPLDTKILLRKKNKIRKELLQTDRVWIEKKIAVLGGATTNEVVEQLALFLLNEGIKTEFYQSEYGQYWQDAVFGTEELDSFSPDIIYIHTNWRNIEKFPKIDDSIEEVDAMLEAEYNRWSTMWNQLSEKFQCTIIQNNFERSNYRLMGNRDIWDYRGASNYISRLNQKIYDYAQKHNNFYINDIDYLAQDYGISNWNSTLYWNMYKYAMNLDAIPYLAKSISDIIKSIYGKNKKIVSLDLDNTLWGGVVGDDGVEGIKIGPEVPVGQMFSEFQSYCKHLKDIGVILSVVSKNDEENALAGLKHPSGTLRPEDFVSIKANWEPKDQNIRNMAQELALGVDSFVFVDDNPAEREIVEMQVPGVAVPVMDKPENYISILDHSGYFEVTTLSKEDIQKTQMYQAKAEAVKQVAAFADYSDYLKSLEMVAILTDFQPMYIQRIAQLTNKSNQFNLTTKRCSEEDIRKMQESGDYVCVCGRLKDKFGDNGIVSVVSGKMEGDVLSIQLWLMSCRVLKRGMEDAMMNELVKQAKEHGIKTIRGYYYPTVKNGMVKDFYVTKGFKRKEEAEDRIIDELQVDSYKERTVYMKVEQRYEQKNDDI